MISAVMVCEAYARAQFLKNIQPIIRDAKKIVKGRYKNGKCCYCTNRSIRGNETNRNGFDRTY